MPRFLLESRSVLLLESASALLLEGPPNVWSGRPTAGSRPRNPFRRGLVFQPRFGPAAAAAATPGLLLPIVALRRSAPRRGVVLQPRFAVAAAVATPGLSLPIVALRRTTFRRGLVALARLLYAAPLPSAPFAARPAVISLRRPPARLSRVRYSAWLFYQSGLGKSYPNALAATSKTISSGPDPFAATADSGTQPDPFAATSQIKGKR